MRKLYCTLYSCLIGCLSYAQTAPQDFFLDDWKAKIITNPVSVAIPITATAPTVTVTVDAANVITKVSKYIYGHNAAAWNNNKMNQDVPLLNTITKLRPNVLRWPGGNMSNDYFWNATSQATCPKDLPPATTTTSVQPPSTFKFNDLFYGANQNSWTLSLDKFYDVLTKTNSTAIMCVNYAYARYGTSTDPVLTAAKYAADWVRYDNGRTKFWEIGNENFGSWETGYDIDQTLNKDGQPKRISGDLYGKHAAVFITEMKKAAAEIGVDIKIGVVALDSKGGNDPVNNAWNSGLMPHIATKADFLILHSYYTPWNQDSKPDVILNTAITETKAIKDYALGTLLQYGGVASLPLALTEWGIFATGSKQGTSYINGIHGAMVLGELTANKFGEATRWDLFNGYDNGNSIALLADGETDITKNDPRAPFYYLYYFQKFFGDKMVASTVTGSTDIRCYASTFTSGQSGMVLVNKGITPQTIDVKLNNFTSGKKYHYYLLTGGTDTEFSRSVFVNGNGSSTAAGGPSNYDVLQANETDIVNKSIKITLPKYSVAYVLVENETLPEINVKQGVTNIINGTGMYEFAPNVAVGSSSTPVTFTIQNTGNADLNIGAISISGANPLSFVLTQVTNPTVSGPLGSAAFTITYKPTFTGAKSAIISIANNDKNESPYTFTLTASTVTGLAESEHNNQEIKVFPNPSTSGVFQLGENTSWVVYTVLGKELKFGNSAEINLSGYPKGVFLIKHQNKMERVTFE